MEKFEYIKGIGVDIDGTVFFLNLIQDYVNKFFPQYSTKNLVSYKRSVTLWLKYQKKIHGILEEAERLGIEPDLSELYTIMFPDGQDEVVRESVREKNASVILGLSEEEWRHYKLYIEPGLMVDEGLKGAQHNLDMFYERRDSVLEADGKKDDGLIPYDKIYSDKNWLPYAKENLKVLYNDFGERLFMLSAHNGKSASEGREIQAKIEEIQRVCPGLKVYGLRFHDSEYDINSDERRSRALKSNAIRKIFGIDSWKPIEGFVVPDDAPFVNDEIYEAGGVPVHVVPYTEPSIPFGKIVNPNNYAMVRSIRPESLYREFTELHLDEPAKALRKKIK